MVLTHNHAAGDLTAMILGVTKSKETKCSGAKYLLMPSIAPPCNVMKVILI